MAGCWGAALLHLLFGKGQRWGRKELELTGSAFLTEQLSTDDYSRNCYLCFMQEAKPVGEIVLPSLHVGNEASPGKLLVWGTVWNILWTNLPSMTWQALLKHAWDLQIKIMQELKLSGRPSQVTDSSPCFYRDRILRGCIDTVLWCAQCFGSGLCLSLVSGWESSLSGLQCFSEGERRPFDTCRGCSFGFCTQCWGLTFSPACDIPHRARTAEYF